MGGAREIAGAAFRISAETAFPGRKDVHKAEIVLTH